MEFRYRTKLYLISLVSKIALGLVVAILFFCNTDFVSYASVRLRGYCGDNLSFTVTDEGGGVLTLTISGTGDMYDYNAVSEAGTKSPWSDDSTSKVKAKDIATIIIEEGVTSIGENAFSGKSGAYPSPIVFPSTLKKINKNAFTGSSIYGNLIIPEGVTYVGNDAFSGCARLNGVISLPSTLKEIGVNAFKGLSKITGKITISNNIKKIPDYAFSGCAMVTEVAFGNSVESIGNFAFDGCGATTITFPSSLKSIGKSAFNKSKLEGTLIVPASVTDIKDSSFKGSALNAVRFLGAAPNEDENAFETKLVTVYYNNGAFGFTTPKWHGYNSAVYEEPDPVDGGDSDGDGEDSGSDTGNGSGNGQDGESGTGSGSSSGGTTGTEPGSTSGGQNNGGANENGSGGSQNGGSGAASGDGTPSGSGTSGNTQEGISGNTGNDQQNPAQGGGTGNDQQNSSQSGGTGNDQQNPSQSGETGNDQQNPSQSGGSENGQQNPGQNGGGQGTGNQSELPGTGTGTGAGSGTGAGTDTSVNGNQNAQIPAGQSNQEKYKYTIVFDSNNASSGSMDEIVVNAGEEEILPKNKYHKTGYVFTQWKYTIGGNTYYVGDGKAVKISEALLKVNNLQAVKFTAQWSKVQTAKVEKIGTAITDRKSASKYVVSSSKNKTVKYVKPVSKKITSVNIPDTVTSKGITYKVTLVDSRAFKDCKSLKRVKVGKNVVKIGNEAFYGCRAISSMELGSGVSSIGTRAFYGCDSLKSLTLPSGTYKLGKQFAAGCDKLKTIHIKSGKITAKSLYDGAFSGIGKRVTIKVPKAKVSTYKKTFRKRGLSTKVNIQAYRLLR